MTKGLHDCYSVQVLTHLKEKLEFVSSQNCDLELKLEEIEKEATSKRDKLAKTKLARDRLRSENIKLQQNMGLLGKMVVFFSEKFSVPILSF